MSLPKFVNILMRTSLSSAFFNDVLRKRNVMFPRK